MSWQGIHGHDRIVEQFRRCLARGRLASSFLFVGPAGVGKRTFAMKFAQTLLCETNAEQQMQPCGFCPACVQVDVLTHPDLLTVAKPKEKSFIPVETFIGDREHRMREGLCHDISLKPFRGGRKIAIIDDADNLNQEGANCLLKTLEEPPPKSVLILIGTSEQRQLPTIRSRCQSVRFHALTPQTVAELLVEHALAEDEIQARSLAELCDGSLQRAVDLADPELGRFRAQFLRTLADPQFDGIELTGVLSAFVDQAGKEAPAKRQRMRLVISFAIEFYRQMIRSLTGAAVEGDNVLNRTVSAGHDAWQHDAETAAACLDRCLAATAHVDSNANQATLLACWLDDLASISRTGHAAIA